MNMQAYHPGGGGGGSDTSRLYIVCLHIPFKLYNKT